jgi:hypothetical protein
MKKFPNEEKIFILSARTSNKLQGIESARKVLENGLENNKLSVKLWIEYVNMEVSQGFYARARPLLEKARVKLKNNASLWCTAV